MVKNGPNLKKLAHTKNQIGERTKILARTLDLDKKKNLTIIIQENAFSVASFSTLVYGGDILILYYFVYESKSIPLNILTDLQLPNLFHHLSSLVPVMQKSLTCDRFDSYRISLNIGC